MDADKLHPKDGGWAEVSPRLCRGDGGQRFEGDSHLVQCPVVQTGPAVHPLGYWNWEGLLGGVGVMCLVLEAGGDRNNSLVAVFVAYQGT